MNPFTLPAWKRLGTLEGVHPDARPYFEELLARGRALGYAPQVASAVRTCEEQAALKSSGSTKAACSWHPFGRAVDLILNERKEHHAAYDELGAWWKSQGGVWGGDFKAYGKNGDYQHFQWTPPPMKEAADLCGDDCQGATDDYWKAVEDAQPEGSEQEPDGPPGGDGFLWPGRYTWMVRSEAEDMAFSTWKQANQRDVKVLGFKSLGNEGYQYAYDVDVRARVPFPTSKAGVVERAKGKTFDERLEQLHPTDDPNYTTDESPLEKAIKGGMSAVVLLAIGFGLVKIMGSRK